MGKKRNTGGNCYSQALGHVLTESLLGRPKTLVHGVIVNNLHQRMGHAWAEWKEDGELKVWDGGQIFAAADYHRLHTVLFAVRYEAHEIGRYIETGHTGPWHPTVSAALHA